MDLELRPCRDDELKRFAETVHAAFGNELNEEDFAAFSGTIDPARLLCAFDRGLLVGTAGAFRFSLAIPGGEVPAAGVTEVGVLPSHRRRGILTRMICRQLDDFRAWGEPVAILWASEGNIYQRFGYGLAAQHAAINVERDRAVFRDSADPVGRIRLVDLDEAVRVLPGIYDRARAGTPGTVERSEEWWARQVLRDPAHRRAGGGPMFRAVVEINGRPEAFAVYRVHPSWGEDAVPVGWLEVIEAVATSPVATREVWRFLFGIDLVARVRASRLAVDHPLPFMVAEPRRLRFTIADAIWLRLVDVAGALAARSYASEDAVVFDVADSFCPWNEGRWRLQGGPSVPRVERTTDRPELRLAAGDLGAAYLGGVTFDRLRQAGRAEELTAGTVTRADALFRTERAPWCPDPF